MQSCTAKWSEGIKDLVCLNEKIDKMKGEKGFRLVKKSEVKIKEQHSPYYIEDSLLLMKAINGKVTEKYIIKYLTKDCDKMIKTK